LNKPDINTRLKIFNILVDNEIKSVRIDHILSSDSTFENYSPQDIRFIHKIVYGIIRHRSKLDYYISKYYKGKFKKCLIKHKIILRIGIFQLFYMDSIPNYAAVNTTVELCKKVAFSKVSLINALMRKLSDNIDLKNQSIAESAIRFSHPKWLIKKWINKWGDDKVLQLLKWNNLEPKIWFRINTLKISIDKMHSKLQGMNIDFSAHSVLNEFFYSDSIQILLKSDMMSQNFISVQNPANGLVVKLLDPQKKTSIFDGCCAPGSKSMYINELTNGQVKINAYDIDARRIHVMNKSLEKNDIKNITCYQRDLGIESIPNYDVGLIDVPCTGTGVISKRVDIKWRRKKEDILEMSKLQSSIISNVSQYLNSGGVLVYSTCSIEKEENWEIVNNFLNSNNNFKLDIANNYVPNEYVDENGCLSIFPPTHALDGIFAARLIKE